MKLATTAVILVACGGQSPTAVDGLAIDAAPSCDAAPVDCSTGNCATIAIANDPPAISQPGYSFNGYADPAIARDPQDPSTFWLAYSYPHGVSTLDAMNMPFTLAAVSSHLAKSTDGGATFTYDEELYPNVATQDPATMTGLVGLLASETVSLVSITTNATTAWYGGHLHYFLQPLKTNGDYNPKFDGEWVVRIGAADSPHDLATAPETVLGLSNTDAAFTPDVALDTLAGLPLQHCSILNNPALFAQNGNLYLVVECLAFSGSIHDYANTTTQVFATVPSGAPTTWSWRYVGKLADHSLAVELSDDTIVEPEVSLAADGTPIFITTPAHADTNSAVGIDDDGCVAFQLVSIDPPVIAKDCAGNSLVRARLTGPGYGSCSHAAGAATGIVTTIKGPNGSSFHASGLAP